MDASSVAASSVLDADAQRIVRAHAYRFWRTFRRTDLSIGLDLEDVLQSAREGAVYCARRWDDSQNVPFSAYLNSCLQLWLIDKFYPARRRRRYGPDPRIYSLELISMAHNDNFDQLPNLICPDLSSRIDDELWVDYVIRRSMERLDERDRYLLTLMIVLPSHQATKQAMASFGLSKGRVYQLKAHIKAVVRQVVSCADEY